MEVVLNGIAAENSGERGMTLLGYETLLGTGGC
jgi:hypothetical protein